MSKAGSSLLRTQLLRSADTARTIDPQLAAIYYTQMVERGANHLKALCVVAAHLWAVLARGTPYELRDIGGRPVSPPGSSGCRGPRRTAGGDPAAPAGRRA
jgi:hypothetical protein